MPRLMPQIFVLYVAAPALLVAGCATTDSGDAILVAEAPAAQEAPASAAADGEGEQRIDAGLAAVENHDKNFDEGDVGDEISHATTENIPIEINADVERWIEYFTVRDRERFQRFIERGEKYRPMITAVLRDQGVPSEIYYQAMIESGFSTAATSRASAVGVWQFIAATGRRYGLRIDSYVDERRDPMRSTVAAALYLKDLYNVFQSWYLAMAAYNAGEGRIMGAIMRSRTRDFWEMVRERALPPETMAYIPKFLAATIVGHDPRRYGIDELRPEVMPALVPVSVPSPVKLADVARLAGIPIEALRDHNPHLLRGVTPPGAATYRLWVPKDQAGLVEAQTEGLAALRITNLKAVAADGPASKTRTHVVARGETLAKVAARYKTTAADLKKLNHLKSTNLRAGMRLAVPESKPATAGADVRRYKVKRGDNLDTIARRFGLSTDELKRLNQLKRSRIQVGQVLKVGSAKG